MSKAVPHCSSVRRLNSVCRSGWCHVHFLFVDLVGILLLPAIVLRRLELGGGEAFFLAVSDAEIFFLSFVLPVSLLIQRAHRQENVGVGIVPCLLYTSDAADELT